jgi:hypothetical protein
MNKKESDKNDKKEFEEGLGYTVGLHIIFACILYLLFLISGKSDLPFLFPIFFIGISQLLYMLPAILIAQGKDRPQLAKGFMIGAAITFLLNAACTGLVFFNGLQ